MCGSEEGAFGVCEVVDSGMRSEVVLSELAGTLRSDYIWTPGAECEELEMSTVQPFVHEALLGKGNISLLWPWKGIHYGKQRRTPLYHTSSLFFRNSLIDTLRSSELCRP